MLKFIEMGLMWFLDKDQFRLLIIGSLFNSDHSHLDQSLIALRLT